MNRRALIIFPGALGDLICAIPAIREISRSLPNTAIELMARAELARFAAGRIGVTQAHSIDRREMSDLFAGGDSATARSFFGKFDRIDSFFAADDEGFRRHLTAVARGQVRFYPFRPPGDGHITDSYLRTIGVELTGPTKNHIELLPEDFDAAKRRLTSLGLTANNFFLIFPGSGSPRKNWPVSSYCALATELQLELPVLFVLGAAESALESQLKLAGAAMVSGLELGEVAALARAARCFVGNDSGVSHLASAAGAAGVVIFGPTDPARWRPLGETEIIRDEPIAGISVNEVLLAMRRLAARSTR